MIKINPSHCDKEGLSDRISDKSVLFLLYNMGLSIVMYFDKVIP